MGLVLRVDDSSASLQHAIHHLRPALLHEVEELASHDLVIEPLLLLSPEKLADAARRRADAAVKPCLDFSSHSPISSLRSLSQATVNARQVGRQGLLSGSRGPLELSVSGNGVSWGPSESALGAETGTATVPNTPKG
eukprot:scaffold2679_cov251-Pinguiococcus_pyrenoidosus.AAC.23